MKVDDLVLGLNFRLSYVAHERHAHFEAFGTLCNTRSRCLGILLNAHHPITTGFFFLLLFFFHFPDAEAGIYIYIYILSNLLQSSIMIQNISTASLELLVDERERERERERESVKILEKHLYFSSET
jgi:hypothetical protein